MRVEPFRFDRKFSLPLGREELWAVLQRTNDYPRWWTWLRSFDVDGAAPGLRAGVVADCLIRGPLPYALRFQVAVDDVVPGERVDTHVTGDLQGPARLELDDDEGGSSARLTWEVELRDPGLRGAALVARPVLEWGHDVVVNRGLEQFRRRALP